MQRVSYFVQFIALLGINFTTFHTVLGQKAVYKTTIESFATESATNLNFINGIHVYIEAPESDEDALYKGFRIVHSDREYNGSWKILYAQTINIATRPRAQQFRAVLYEHKGVQRIVLYRKESENQYYFRIFNTTYTAH